VKKIDFKLVTRAVVVIIGIFLLICIFLKSDGKNTRSAYRDIKKGNYEQAIEKLENNDCYNDKNSKALLGYAYFLNDYGTVVNYPQVDKLSQIQKYSEVEVAAIVYLSPSKESRYYEEIHALYEKVEKVTKEAEKEYIATKPKENNDTKKGSGSYKSNESKNKSGTYSKGSSSKSSGKSYGKTKSSDAYDEGYDSVYMDEDYDWDRYQKDDDYARGVDDAMEDMDEDW